MSGSSGTERNPYYFHVGRRILLVATGACLLLLAVASAVFYWFLSGDGVRVALEHQATQWLGQPVTIARAEARLFPRPGITLRDVRAGDPVRMMLADVQVSTGLKPLWSRRIEDAEV